ncbi:esterase/lipase family protein [Hyphomicrobium sp.]|uniref:esterase/lipase family protein n=1 Tax=Hyphomicrobium sp. TaxID=82 RepID=UPI003F6F5490
MKQSITLVHGTFAPEAPWTNEGSYLCQALQVRFTGTAEIHRFQWTGKNNHRHRRQAASELEAHLTAEVERKPHSDHFIICHSHGGNIALMALRDPSLQSKVAAVICLNTPFLHAFQRSLFTALFLPVTIILVASLIMFYPAALAATEASWSAEFTLLAAGCCLVLLAALLNRLFPIDALQNLVPKVIDELTLPAISNVRVTCITTASDEVFDGLNGLSAFNSFLLHLLRPRPLFVTLTAIAVTSLAGWLPPFPALESIPFLGSELARIRTGNAETLSAASILIYSFASAALYGATLIVVVHLFAWARLKWYGAQGIPLYAAPHVAVLTTPTPVTAESIRFVEIDAFQLRLNHSASYTNPEIVALVVDLLKPAPKPPEQAMA